MWLMLGLAGGILGIIVFAGRQEPTATRSAPTVVQAASTPNPERLRDYQDRLRVLDDRARRQIAAESLPATDSRLVREEPRSARSVDPLETERKRREYPEHQTVALDARDVVVNGSSATSLTANQWADVKRVGEMLPDADITIRVHKISWTRDTRVDVPITFGVLVSKRHGPFMLRREYLPDFR